MRYVYQPAVHWYDSHGQYEILQVAFLLINIRNDERTRGRKTGPRKPLPAQAPSKAEKFATAAALGFTRPCKARIAQRLEFCTVHPDSWHVPPIGQLRGGGGASVQPPCTGATGIGIGGSDRMRPAHVFLALIVRKPHYMSNGEKPYMTYSMTGGTGYVAQNVAFGG